MTAKAKCFSSSNSNRLSDKSTHATTLIRGKDLDLQMSALMAMLAAAERDDMEALDVAEKEAKVRCGYLLDVSLPQPESNSLEEGEVMMDLNRALTALAECAAQEERTRYNTNSRTALLTEDYRNLQPISAPPSARAPQTSNNNNNDNDNTDAPDKCNKITRRSTIATSDRYFARRPSLDGGGPTRYDNGDEKEEMAEEPPLENKIFGSAPPTLRTKSLSPLQNKERLTRRHPDYVTDAYRSDIVLPKTTDLLPTTTNDLHKHQHASGAQDDCASTVVSDLTMPTVATYCDPPDFLLSPPIPNNNDTNNSYLCSNNRMNSGWKMMNSRDTTATRKLGMLSAAELSRQVNERAGDEHVHDLQEDIYMHLDDDPLKNATPKKQDVILEEEEESSEEEDPVDRLLGLSSRQRSNTPQPSGPRGTTDKPEEDSIEATAYQRRRASPTKACDNPPPPSLRDLGPGKTPPPSSAAIRSASAVGTIVTPQRIVSPPLHRRTVDNSAFNAPAHTDNDLVKSANMNTSNTATKSLKTSRAGTKLSTITPLHPPSTATSSPVTLNPIDKTTNKTKETSRKNKPSKLPSYFPAHHSHGPSDDAPVDSAVDNTKGAAGSKKLKPKKKKLSISNMLDGRFGRSVKDNGKEKKTPPANSIPVGYRHLSSSSSSNGKRRASLPQQPHHATTATTTNTTIKRLTYPFSDTDYELKESSIVPFRKIQSQMNSEDDLDTVVSTLGQDIDFIFHELSVLEEKEEVEKSITMPSVLVDNQEKEAGTINTATALGATAKIKYNLGSVASSLRSFPKKENMATIPSSTTTSRGLYSDQEMRENGMSVYRTSQRNLMNEGWTRQPLEGVDERKPSSYSGVGSTTSSLTQSKALSCNASLPREGPLLIDEDGFIISSRPAHISNTVSKNDDPDFPSFSRFNDETLDFALPTKKTTTGDPDAKHKISIDNDGFLLLSGTSTPDWSNSEDDRNALEPIKGVPKQPLWWKDPKGEAATVNKDSRRPGRFHMEWALKEDDESDGDNESKDEHHPPNNTNICDNDHNADRSIDQKEKEVENKPSLSKRTVRESETLECNQTANQQRPGTKTSEEELKNPVLVSARYQQQQQYAMKDEIGRSGSHLDSQLSGNSLAYTDETSRSPVFVGIKRLDTAGTGAVVSPGIAPVDLTASRNTPTNVAAHNNNRKTVAMNVARRSSRSLMSRNTLPSIVETEEKDDITPNFQMDDDETATITTVDHDGSTKQSNAGDTSSSSLSFMTSKKTKEVRIDEVEAATKRRIELLRKLVANRAQINNEQQQQQQQQNSGNTNSSRSGGGGDRVTLDTKLDFVERETMKQIARLRDRLSLNIQ